MSVRIVNIIENQVLVYNNVERFHYMSALF